jgi:GNAT superfamily N-acetyltransferase
VLWPHRPDVESCTIDEDGAPDARHLGAFTPNGDLVGVLSLFAQRSERFPAVIDPAVPVYRLRAMGVLPEFRRQRVGESLIAAACDTARTLGAAQLWCDAREAALPFYEALGFRCLSPTYEIPPIGPHRMMAREL